MDQAMNENVKLSQANRGLDDLLGAGSNILQDLQFQRGTLKVWVCVCMCVCARARYTMPVYWSFSSLKVCVHISRLCSFCLGP